jgi:hypothetical protein
MPCDLHLIIQEDSRRWQAVQKIAQERHITREQAVEQVFDAGVRAQVGERKARRMPNLEVTETMPIFGMFADKPEFSEAIDRVIASRSERYAKFTA